MDNGDTSTVDLLKEFLTADIIAFIMENTGVSADEAMRQFYNSEVFDRVEDAETGLYRESSGYVYALYKQELAYGGLMQPCT
ncbi:MAG: hypothetical protein LBD20_01365 [Spirochaetaceae bacterium]|jgi:hypothetical protein|nr:hypothetical protein [Spirochaetaceae bacterium]